MSDQQTPDPDTEESNAPENIDQVSAGEESTVEVSIELLQKQLEEAREEAEEQKNIALRAVAEGQNARRRAENEVSNARKFALERFVGDLLPALDSLERGIETIDADKAEVESPLKTLHEGSVLTLKMILDVLAKNNVVIVDPVGEPFDPQYHEAMAMVENPGAEPNSVLDVMQKGYSLNGRLVRPARVVVSREKS